MTNLHCRRRKWVRNCETTAHRWRQVGYGARGQALGQVLLVAIWILSYGSGKVKGVKLLGPKHFDQYGADNEEHFEAYFELFY